MAAVISLNTPEAEVWTYRKNYAEAYRLGWTQCPHHANGCLAPGMEGGYNYCPCIVDVPNLNPNKSSK